MSVLRVAVVVGSVRRGRNTPRLARLVFKALAADERTEPVWIDLAEYELPIMQERLRLLEDPPERLVAFGRAIDRADALVIATPEYNKAIPGALKNAIDYLGSEYRHKPVGVASHSVGAFGGIVAQQQLRLIMLNLGAILIPATLTVPRIEEAIDVDGVPADPAIARRAGRLIDELVWLGQALRDAREA